MNLSSGTNPQLDNMQASVLEFFCVFARVEYALKRSGFVKSGRNDSAEPDWGKFERAIDERWIELQGEAFVSACAYLLRSPPRRQILHDGGLEWAELTRSNASDASFILRCVRTVRNNLFHGGKFPELLVAPPERDARLLESGVTVLRGALKLEPAVQDAFDPD